MKTICCLVAFLCTIQHLVADDVRLLDLEPPDAQQVIEKQDQSLHYAPKVDSNVPAVRYLGNEPHDVQEDIYLARQYHGQDGVGGYLYGYNIPDIAKTEKKVAGGDLRGAYNYISQDGQEIKVEYWDDGTGFHQVDNVPKILPKDSPEVAAEKDKFLARWHEEAERNQHPVTEPYDSNGNYATGPLSLQGQLESKKQLAAQYPQPSSQGSYQQTDYSKSSGQYPGQYNQQSGGSYQQSGSNQQPGQFQSSGQGQYQQPGHQQSGGQYQQTGQGQYQQPGHNQQSGGQYQQSGPGQYQQPGQHQQSGGQYQQPGQYQQSGQGQHQQSGQGQYQQPGQNQQSGGQYQQPGQYQQSGQGQYQQPGQHQQSGGQYQQPGQYQHSGQSGQNQQSGLSGLPNNQIDYSGQYSENQNSYSNPNQNQKPGHNEPYNSASHQTTQYQQGSQYSSTNEVGNSGQYDQKSEEENGPPKGFFYSYDYPVGKIVSVGGIARVGNNAPQEGKNQGSSSYSH